jgi:hypothetical protein
MLAMGMSWLTAMYSVAIYAIWPRCRAWVKPLIAGIVIIHHLPARWTQ